MRSWKARELLECWKSVFAANCRFKLLRERERVAKFVAAAEIILEAHHLAPPEGTKSIAGHLISFMLCLLRIPKGLFMIDAKMQNTNVHCPGILVNIWCK